jgi:RNA polymerase sigma factor (sigma-70 family)
MPRCKAGHRPLLCGRGNKLNSSRVSFETQVLPHLDATYRFARWLARSPEDAQDLVQEAMLRAYRGFDALRGSDAKAWLLTIVRNCHATALKQQRRRAQVPLPEEHDALDGQALISTALGPQEESIRRDQTLTLERLIERLPEDYREVLILREIEDMDYRAIAEITQVPLGTVMSRLARARSALRQQWLRHVEGEPRAVR